MSTLSASEARANLYRLMDQAAESHQPITITGKRHDAVLLSAEDWQAIQETLYLLSVPVCGAVFLRMRKRYDALNPAQPAAPAPAAESAT